MEGNNAEPTEAQKKDFANRIISIIENCLRLLVPDGEVKHESKGTFKIHVTELDSDGILGLSGLAKMKGISIKVKRSGTGITIIVTIEKPEEQKPELKVV